MRLVRFAAALACMLGMAYGDLQAQPYPSRPLKLIVPYPPGGVTDILGRALAKEIAQPLGQPVLVENRPGAGGAIGTEAVARSAADGHTLLLGASSTHVLNPILYKVSYDPVKDFDPVGLVASTPLVLVVNPQVPARNVVELIAWLRRHASKASFGSYGNASASHLAGELFKAAAGVDMLHVPYKGAAPAQNELIGGQIALMFSDMSAMQHVKSGKLRALAVTSAQRSAAFPEIPTVAESGILGFEVAGWFGLYVPAGVPRAITARLSTELAAAVKGPELHSRLLALGLDPRSSTPEELIALMQTERVKWEKVIANAKVKVE